MRPNPDRFLEVAMIHLMAKTGPALGEGYEQSSVMVLALMLGGVREECERGAARRVEENAALRALFSDAAPVVGDAALRERLDAAAAGEDADLAISSLEAGNCVLRGLLIELHSHVEELESPDARRVEAAIWRELAASTERRRLEMGAF